MLEIKNLNKSYGDKLVLKNINCKLINGVYGLLGPNGAGKSTLMNIITTNLKADSGSILWDGNEIRDLGKDYLSILGYMPQSQGFYDGFTGYMFLNYIAVLKDIPKKEIKFEIDRVTEAVNLVDSISNKIDTYSAGMKQRLLIASAIIGNPKLIIFDEPTAGLDPKERVRVKKMISSFSKDKIVIIATHIVPDVENMAKNILILKDGVLLDETEYSKLVKRYAPGGTLEDVYMSIFANGDQV
jgi:ABC-type multidrug transport system ATPase subunit